jgi:hypothetical protein
MSKLPVGWTLHQFRNSDIKQLSAKAGHAAVAGLRAILIEVMAETAKKAIWGTTPGTIAD